MTIICLINEESKAEHIIVTEIIFKCDLRETVTQEIYTITTSI